MRTAICLFLWCAAAGGLADVLHLADGSRQYGELLAEDRTAVTFRVVPAGGAASMVRVFPRALVRSVQRTGRCDAPPAEPAAEPATQPVSTQAAEDAVRAGWERRKAGDLGAAVRIWQDVAVHLDGEANADAAARLNALCRDECAAPLDELLARTRFALAGGNDASRPLKLTVATAFERPALLRLLTDDQERRLTHRHAGRTLSEWAADRGEYRTLTGNDAALVADASRTAALIGARLRFDPALRTDRTARAALVAQQADLTRLAAWVMGLPGYTSRGQPASAEPAAGTTQPVTTQPAPPDAPVSP